jgi:hypothetical protein
MTETEADRLDRELNELLQELRVLLPGVQVLFAFLLTLPFTVGFENVTDAERLMFFGAFVSTTISAVLLVAPGVRHRGRFREHDKEALVTSGNRLALGATVFLGLAIATVAALIGEYLYGWWAGAALGSGVVLLAGWFWYAWAFVREVRRRRG